MNRGENRAWKDGRWKREERERHGQIKNRKENDTEQGETHTHRHTYTHMHTHMHTHTQQQQQQQQQQQHNKEQKETNTHSSFSDVRTSTVTLTTCPMPTPGGVTQSILECEYQSCVWHGVPPTVTTAIAARVPKLEPSTEIVLFPMVGEKISDRPNTEGGAQS